MAYGDYIHCCKCDVKLIYDGDRNQREWWIDRFDKEPEIECPDCKVPQPAREWVGLTDEDKAELDERYGDDVLAHLDAIEAKLKEKNT